MGQAMGMAKTPAPLRTALPVLLTSSPPGLRPLLHQSQEQWRVWPHSRSVWTLTGPSITGRRWHWARSRASVLKPPPSAVASGNPSSSQGFSFLIGHSGKVPS